MWALLRIISGTALTHPVNAQTHTLGAPNLIDLYGFRSNLTNTYIFCSIFTNRYVYAVTSTPAEFLQSIGLMTQYVVERRGSVVSVSDVQARDHGFDPRPR